MSFGFSVGDFIAAIELTNKIRKGFTNAPGQFKAVTDEVRSLSIVLQDADIAFPEQGQRLSDDQKKDLEEIDRGCQNILEELQRIIEKNSELASESGNGSVGKKIKRVWKKLNWKQDDIDEIRSRLSTHIGLLNAFNSRLTRKTMTKLVRHQESQEDQAILDWLTPIDYATQQNEFISRRQAGTGQWLLDSTEFQTWLETDQQTLFCPGIPGAGKTILTAVIIDNLTTRFQNNSDIGIAYLYGNFRRKSEQTAQDLLASLLKQLSQRRFNLPDGVKSLYNKHIQTRTRPSLEEITSTLHSVINIFSRVMIAVDALDECQISDGSRKTFLNELLRLQTTTRANLFVTSRHILEITESFQGSIICEIRAHTEDVRQYLSNRISQSGNRLLETHCEEIITEITKVVDGMFLLAQLHFESVSTKKTRKKMKDVLKSLPSGPKAYDYAYEEAMKRITSSDTDSVELAKSVLSWITFCNRPLTTTELQCALAIEVGKSELDEENLPQIEDMVSVCAGLVTIDGESSIIRLVHYTTQEYFERSKAVLFPAAQSEITTTCVTYLSFDEFSSGSCQTEDELEHRFRSHRLYDYASLNWGHHARAHSTSMPVVNRFLERKPHLEAASQAVLFGSRSRGGFSNLKKITALQLAASFGIEYAIKLLLENGADMKISNDYHERTPLLIASTEAQTEIIKLLLENGANVNEGGIDEKTPLGCASICGHIEVVKLLLEKGAAVDIFYQDRDTPLFAASAEGHIEVVKLLLEASADANIADIREWTPLLIASWEGHIEITKLLLEASANVNLANEYGRTPLLQASEEGYIEIVKLLLEAGADVNMVDKFGSTPLQRVSWEGYIEIAKLLLEAGANVNLANKYGRTPLYEAYKRKDDEMSKLLLENGVKRLSDKDLRFLNQIL